MIAWDEGAVTSYTPRSVHRVKCRCGVRLELDTDGRGNVLEYDARGVHRCPGPRVEPELPKPRAGGRAITKERERAIIEAWTRGDLVAEITTIVSCSSWTVYKVVREHGLPLRRAS